tara:strand:- start:958 stop:2562 length:1605 start_codon:yes stop_codon:yes gene_type:complete
LNQTRIKNNELGYLGNPNIKRDGIEQSWAADDIREYAKCMKDPVYFARKYLKVISLDDGLVDFDLYPYQEDMFEHFDKNRFSIVLACRQSGKSISSVAYLVWYAIFHPEKTIAILANKGATAREMLARATLMLENIPFFLQPGCKAVNKGSIEFSNNSRILAAATSGSSIRGLSVNLLFLDEFAFVENAAEFYSSTYPVVSAGKDTKVIITSTANGLGNIYHKLWEGAVQSTNEFKPFRIDWWDVPGRDEEWKKQTVSNTSELQFDQEFGNNFHGSGNTLISGNKLLGMKAKPPIYTQESVKVYDRPMAKHDYMMFVDVAKGRGQDYSTFNLVDISTRPFKQVAVYRDNNISPILFPDIIYKYAKTYNEAYVVIESNDQGAVVCNGLYYDLEYENVFVESMVKKNAIGIEMNRKVKRIGCSNIKDLVERDQIEIVDADTIIEFSTFVAKGTSYEASDGNHDDLVMNFVLFGWFVSSPLFNDMTDMNIKEMMYNEKMKQIEDELVPFGVLDDGQPAESEVINGERWHIDTETELY